MNVIPFIRDVGFDPTGQKKDFPFFELTKIPYKDVLDIFQYESFREKQFEAIKATLAGIDLFLMMPPGSGKGFVYQLPGIVTLKVTIIISPYKARIRDEMKHMNRFCLRPVFLDECSKDQLKEVHNDIYKPKSTLRFIFVTPKWIAGQDLYDEIIYKACHNNKVARFVFDDLQAMPERKYQEPDEYLNLGMLRTLYPDVPILGLFSCANFNTWNNAREMLNLICPLICIHGFDNGNRLDYKYETFFKKELVD